VIASFASATAEVAGAGKCGEKMARKMDEESSKCSILGRPGGQFPYDLESGQAYCSDGKSAVRFIRNFAKKCVDSITKQALNLLAYGVNKQLRSYCKSDSSIQATAAKTSCLNKDLPSLNKHWADFGDNCKKLLNFEPSDKIQGLCCGYNLMLRKMEEDVSKICSPDDTKAFLGFVNGFVGDVFELFCSQSPPGSKICEIAEEKLAIAPFDNSTKTLTPMPIMIEVLKSL
jgi:hypothetical protein